MDTRIDYFFLASDLRSTGRKTKTGGGKTCGYTDRLFSRGFWPAQYGKEDEDWRRKADVWIHRSIILSWPLICAIEEGRRRLAEESTHMDTH